MTTTLTVRQMAAVKRNAQNTASFVAQKARREELLKQVQEELDMLNASIEAYEAGTKAITGGYTSMDLVEKVVEGTGKFDSKGKEIKITKYVPKADVVTYNEEKKVYEIHVPELEALPETIEVAPEAVEMVEGNDVFDPTQVQVNQ